MKKLFFLLCMSACIFAAYAQSADGETLFIVFSPDSADLRTVSPEQAIRNSKVFTSVAQLLLDNPRYRILLDGHANPVEKTFKEERDSLKPLSEQRAEAAANFLVDYFGVERHRIILTGAGGRYSFFGNVDPALNRRVNFLLIITQ